MNRKFVSTVILLQEERRKLRKADQRSTEWAFYPGFFTDSLKGATHELNVFSRHTLNIILTYSNLKYFHS